MGPRCCCSMVSRVVGKIGSPCCRHLQRRGVSSRLTIAATEAPGVQTVIVLQADPLCGGALTNHDVDAALAALPSIQHFHFPGAGHQLHRDRTDAMLDALCPFFHSLSVNVG